MEIKGRESSNSTSTVEDEMDLRRGPWTVDEDLTLMNYIATHGEGRWNSLARSAGLKRTGKSCRLRWLNYLRPDVRRGNITHEEQLLILELHSRWGNRWSKIAQYLPGRTDNEIKNYWRTRVQKHAKQLKCDVNSKLFKDTMRYLWMPRLVERIHAAGATPSAVATTPTIGSPTLSPATIVTTTSTGYNYQNNLKNNNFEADNGNMVLMSNDFGAPQIRHTYTSENSTGASSDSFGTQVSPISDLTDCYNIPARNNNPNSDYYQPAAQVNYSECITSPLGFFTNQGWDFQSMEPSDLQWVQSGDTSDNFWNAEDLFFQYHQLNNNM